MTRWGTNTVYYVNIYTSAYSSFQLKYLYLYGNYVYIYAMVYKFITVYYLYSRNDQYYCWWKKSCTIWDVQNLVNNGIFDISTKKTADRKKNKDCSIFSPFRFTPEVQQPATETSNPTSLPGDKKRNNVVGILGEPWTNKPPGKIGILNFEPKVMLISWKDGEGWENHQRNGEDEKLHSGKSTWNPKSWRWMDSEDDFPFSIGWVLGLQPIIFQG